MKLHHVVAFFRAPTLLGFATLALGWGTPGARGDTNFAGRLDASFRPDPNFSIPLYSHQRAVMALQADGKVLFGGNFGQEGTGVIRLTADGSVDPSFHGETKVEFDALSALVVQPDGKILLGGASVTRLLANGDPDPNFEASVSGRFWWNRCRCARVASGWKNCGRGWIFRGEREPCFGIARLPDGSRDPVQRGSDDARQVSSQLQANGRILIAGYTPIRSIRICAGLFCGSRMARAIPRCAGFGSRRLGAGHQPDSKLSPPGMCGERV